jgi:hypothetical protein
MDSSAAGRRAKACYLIRVRGTLDPRWSAWFDGLTIVNDEGGTTMLSGEFTDQAALFGLISRIRDLGLELLSVARCD